MDAVRGVLEEELKYAMGLEKQYQDAVEKLPKGSLSRKNINGHLYHYLAYREGTKVKFQYLGKLSGREIEEMQSRLAERRRYQEMLRAVRKEIRYLQKVMNVKAA